MLRPRGDRRVGEFNAPDTDRPRRHVDMDLADLGRREGDPVAVGAPRPQAGARQLQVVEVDAEGEPVAVQRESVGAGQVDVPGGDVEGQDVLGEFRQGRSLDLGQGEPALGGQGRRAEHPAPGEAFAPFGHRLQRKAGAGLHRAEIMQLEADRGERLGERGGAGEVGEFGAPAPDLQVVHQDLGGLRARRRLAAGRRDQVEQVQAPIGADHHPHARRIQPDLGEIHAAPERGGRHPHGQPVEADHRLAVGVGQAEVLGFQPQGERIEPHFAELGLAVIAFGGLRDDLRTDQLRRGPEAERGVERDHKRHAADNPERQPPPSPARDRRAPRLLFDLSGIGGGLHVDAGLRRATRAAESYTTPIPRCRAGGERLRSDTPASAAAPLVKAVGVDYPAERGEFGRTPWPGNTSIAANTPVIRNAL